MLPTLDGRIWGAGVEQIEREVGNGMDTRYRIKREVNLFRALLEVKEVRDNIIELLDVVASQCRASFRNSI